MFDTSVPEVYKNIRVKGRWSSFYAYFTINGTVVPPVNDIIDTPTKPAEPNKQCSIQKNNPSMESCYGKLGTSNSSRTIAINAREGETNNLFLNIDQIDDSKYPTKITINGSVSNDFGVIYVSGDGEVNIWLNPSGNLPYDSNYNFYTLPAVIKENPSDKVTVNIIAIEEGFNLVVFNRDRNNSDKSNGSVYANIIIPNGTVILASDKVNIENDGKPQLQNMGEDIIVGSIQAKNIIIDASARNGTPFNINTEDAMSGIAGYVSLGHSQ